MKSHLEGGVDDQASDRVGTGLTVGPCLSQPFRVESQAGNVKYHVDCR